MKIDPFKPRTRVGQRSNNVRKMRVVNTILSVLLVIVLTVIGLGVYGSYLNGKREKPVDPMPVTKVTSAPVDTSVKHVAPRHKPAPKVASSTHKSSVVSSSSSAVSSQSTPAPQRSTNTSSVTDASASQTQSSEVSSSEKSDSDYAVLQPEGGQALYSWAVAHGTSAAEIYALNPGLTASNWSSYVGQSIRIK